MSNQPNRKVRISYTQILPATWTDERIKQCLHMRLIGPITADEISSVTIENLDATEGAE